MATTTTLGSWVNHTTYNLTVEDSVATYISGGDREWRERVEASGAFERMVSDYRDEINAALPPGVFLTGDEFIGPYYEADQEFVASDYPCTDEGDVDIAEIINGIDLAAIVERHDPGHSA